MIDRVEAISKQILSKRFRCGNCGGELESGLIRNRCCCGVVQTIIPIRMSGEWFFTNFYVKKLEPQPWRWRKPK